MSTTERQYLEVLSRIIRQELTRAAAASLLSISERQVYRLLARMKLDGEAGLVHRLRGRSSNRCHVRSDRERVLSFYRQPEFRDYGPQLFGEILRTQYNLDVSRETLRRWLMAAGLWSGRRAPRRHRRKRARREGIGTLVQFDGSPHDWFEGRGPSCCLLVAIDDCSSRVFMRFAPSEDTEHVMRTLWSYIERYGIPQALYTDHGSVYCNTSGSKPTETGRALAQLGIQIIFANSPQAKGRVERANRTQQDRLIKAMRRERIATIEAANIFLEQHYLAQHNAQFAVTDGKSDVHRTAAGLNLAKIFCIEQQRQVRGDYTVLLDGEFLQLERSEAPMPAPRTYIIVQTWLDGSLHLYWKEHELAYTRILNKPVGPGRSAPAKNHPWRKRWAKTEPRTSEKTLAGSV